MSRFTLICGSDEYLVQRAGAQAWSVLCTEVADEFSREVINGFCGNVSEVEASVKRFREALETLDLFGGRKVVWFKDVNFLGEAAPGRTEGAKAQVELMQHTLGSVDAAGVGVLITASPVDRRTTFFKWADSEGKVTVVGGDKAADGAEGLAHFARGELDRVGASAEPEALALLLERTDGKSRVLVNEIEKLATHARSAEGPATITAAMVDLLTPNYAEGDFFEAADAFFRRDLEGTLAAIRTHFFGGEDARPLLTSLQNRTRLILQLRALSDAGHLGAGGVNKAALESVGRRYAASFEGVTEKSTFFLASQNPFYLSQLSSGSKVFSLAELLSLQLDLVETFRKINDPRFEQEAVMRDLAVRHLTKKRAKAA